MPISEVYNMDCMEYMKGIPDKFFDLAIVDPQYGIDIMHKGGMPKHLGFKQYKRKDWDKKPPGKRYFQELFRVSKNQIIFGGNYFTQHLPPKMGWIVWDKGQHGLTMSDGELAWSSFDKALRIITLNRCTIGERGGNHFIELGRAESTNNIFLTIHTGSRNFGVKVCKYHAEIAKFDKKAFSNEIQRLKSTVEPQFMQTEILRLKEKFAEYSGYLTNEAMLHYLCDMVIAQGYAAFNRKLIIQRIIRTLSWNATISVETVHNYISFDDMIIRKGAIAAYANDYVVIPMNMADGILLCRGKGNKDWNYSAPHGAGRLYSRSEAKERLSMDAFKTQMSKVYSTSVCEGTLDESPMAYKNVQEIKELIEPTVEIIDTIVPLINIKAV